MSDRETESSFLWIDGYNGTFSNWKSGEPNNGGNGEDCVHFYGKANFDWNDAPCNFSFGYICESETQLYFQIHTEHTTFVLLIY